MFADARWPPCSLTSPRRPGPTTPATLSMMSGDRYRREEEERVVVMT